MRLDAFVSLPIASRFAGRTVLASSSRTALATESASSAVGVSSPQKAKVRGIAAGSGRHRAQPSNAAAPGAGK